MDAEVRRLIAKLKPEVSKVIFVLDDYLASKDELSTLLIDSNRPIIEGRQFLGITREYMAIVSSVLRGSELESKIAYLKNEARETVEWSMPYHIRRLTQEFPEIMNGHAPNPSSPACQPAAEVIQKY